jgi:MFS family permease
VALLGATIIGTLSNNIINVPLRTITESFHAPVSEGVLLVSSFVLVLASGMAISGWVGDRFGRSRTLSAALILMVVSQMCAAVASSLAVLVAIRGLQGLACSAIPPCVMGMLAEIYPAERRSRIMGAWAAANGVGQAAGPPLGGLITDLWGWRAIFWLLAVLTVPVIVATRRLPRDHGRLTALHWRGAAFLIAGAALVMTAATAVPQHAVPIWVDVLLGASGLVLLALFVRTSLRTEHPLIDPRLIVEARFLRSAVATFTQMFALVCVLVVVPLYATGTLELSIGATGLLLFALPMAMALLAPLVGNMSDRLGPRRVMRSGLAILALACIGLGYFTGRHNHSLLVLCLLLVVVGAGVALVQTPSATGATRSPAGHTGTALGLFNMMRFGGSAFGAAWVAVVYRHGELLLLFSGAALLLLAALVASVVGPDPESLATTTGVEAVLH